MPEVGEVVAEPEDIDPYLGWQRRAADFAYEQAGDYFARHRVEGILDYMICVSRERSVAGRRSLGVAHMT